MIDECLRLAAQAERGSASKAPSTIGSAPQVLALAAGDYLYRGGDARRSFYRVERGALAVFETHVGCANSAVEIASVGEIVGLGTLDRYCETARAIVDSSVACISHAEFIAIAEGDSILRKKQADAIEREFEHRKAQLSGGNHSTPVECLAAFLIAVSRQNAYDGRDPTIISDSLECGVVASLLDIDIDILSHALLELKHLGLIEDLPDGRVRLKSVPRIERLSEQPATISRLATETRKPAMPVSEASLVHVAAESPP
jgi:CRP/FNR family transcriptional regulator